MEFRARLERALGNVPRAQEAEKAGKLRFAASLYGDIAEELFELAKGTDLRNACVGDDLLLACFPPLPSPST